MAKLPDVYQIFDQYGYGVVVIGKYLFSKRFEEASWLLKEEAEEFLMQYDSLDVNIAIDDKYHMVKVDDELVRRIGKNFISGIEELGQNEELYPSRTINPIIQVLKDEKDNLIRLSKALQPERKELINMKENQIAVRFYEGFISNEKVTLKQGENTINMKRVKLPNDDPNDSQVRRSFIVRESSIGTDTKNPHMRFVYLDKNDKDGNEIEYRVVRKNFDPETKKSEIIEDIKMTAQAISDVFRIDRDRQYAEYKASQESTQDDLSGIEIDEPEETIEVDTGIEI